MPLDAALRHRDPALPGRPLRRRLLPGGAGHTAQPGVARVGVARCTVSEPVHPPAGKVDPDDLRASALAAWQKADGDQPLEATIADLDELDRGDRPVRLQRA